MDRWIGLHIMLLMGIFMVITGLALIALHWFYARPQIAELEQQRIERALTGDANANR